MAMCGFNKKMLDGLKLFGEGLYDQAVKNAAKNSLSLRESFEWEVQEMDIFIPIVAQKSAAKFQALRGIAEYAQSLYKNAQGLDDPKNTYFEALNENLEYFVEVDRVYYDELFPKIGKQKEALEELGKWMG